MSKCLENMKKAGKFGEFWLQELMDGAWTPQDLELA